MTDGHPRMAESACEEVLVLDFGGQYSQLIARRIRECGVFAELLPHDTALERIRERRPAALVLSGGPASVYSDGAPELRRELLELDLPVLGICYGMQAMVHVLGGRVEGADAGEFGRTSLVLADATASSSPRPASSPSPPARGRRSPPSRAPHEASTGSSSIRRSATRRMARRSSTAFCARSPASSSAGHPLR